MVADGLEYVIGVDSHRDRHAFAVLSAAGATAAEYALAASGDGYAEALALADAYAPGRRVWAIEGTGCYGAGLARFLVDRDERVFEVERPKRSGCGARLKSDPLDALRAARTVLAGERLARPRSGGQRESLRALLATRAGAVTAKQAALCQLRSLIVTLPEPRRAELRRLTRGRLLHRCAALRPRAGLELAGTLLALRCCARRALAAEQESRQLERAIATLVNQLAPSLLDEPGVGPITAAQLLISWSHPGRIRNEAAFARLAGAAPIPASSGQKTRYRLDRGGDRQLNRALHTIILSRRKHHPQTIAYIQRRQRDGKTSREAVRCLKRYLARHLYRHLEATTAST